MFLVGSALCGMAWSVESLIAFRLLQGVGGGMLTPVGTAMLFRAFPLAERAKGATIITVPTVLAPALGPVLGGGVGRHGGLALDLLRQPADRHRRLRLRLALPAGARRGARRPLGSVGLLGSRAAALALLLYALSQVPEAGWQAPRVLVTGIVGLLCGIALVWIELRRHEPMLDLRLFRDRMFRGANVDQRPGRPRRLIGRCCSSCRSSCSSYVACRPWSRA